MEITLIFLISIWKNLIRMKYKKMQILLIICFQVAPALADHELVNRDIVRGKENYQSQCASCHGVDLEGQPNWRNFKEDGNLPAPPHDENGHTWHHDTGTLFDYTKLGGQATLEAAGVTDYNSGMPAFDGILTDQEIWEILTFIRSTWSLRIQQAHAKRH